ncbi:P4 gene product [Spissistilus festinus reovirus]|uniref:P4 n=1 Tax=Spissistilus festinus reovirus TaxID=1004049 RepID=UPI00024D946F|nr:P4 gene product [Spissistilus festinus reovirus]AEC32490.1 structural protein [Spissistilus festinus reovirus]
MSWKPNLIIFDARANEDPTADLFMIQMKEKIRYVYHFDSSNLTHDLKLQGLWARYHPSPATLSDVRFSQLYSQDPLDQKSLDKLVTWLQSSVPVPKFPPGCSPNARVSMLTFWMGQANDWGGTWKRYLTDPWRLLYEYGTSPVEWLFGNHRVQYLLSTPKHANIAYSPSVRRTIWFKSDVFMRSDWEQLINESIPLGSVLCMHHTYTWNHPHGTLIGEYADLVIYLSEKIVDQILIQKNMFSGVGFQITRAMEGVALLGDVIRDDRAIHLLRALPMLWIPESAYGLWRKGMTVQDIIQMAYVTFDMLPAQTKALAQAVLIDSSLIGIPKILSPYCHSIAWPNAVIFDGVDYKQEHIIQDVTLQKREPIEWSALPTGDDCEIASTEPVMASTTAIALDIPFDRYYNLSDNLGRCFPLAGDVSKPNEAQLLVWEAQALYGFQQPISDNAYRFRDTARFLPNVTMKLDSQRNEIANMSGEVKPSASSVEVVVRALLFDRPPSIANGHLLPPIVLKDETHPPKQVLNNSTVKEINLVMFLVSLHTGQPWDARFPIQESYRLSPWRITLFGTITNITGKVIKKIFPNATVKGGGLETVMSGGVRTNIFEAFTRNWNADIVISDIDQTGFLVSSTPSPEQFKAMITFCEDLLAVVVRTGAVGAMKLNFPSPYLLYKLIEIIEGYKIQLGWCVYVGHGQNSYASEVYFCYYLTDDVQQWYGPDHALCQWSVNYLTQFETKAEFQSRCLGSIPDKSAEGVVKDLLSRPGAIVTCAVPNDRAMDSLISALSLSDRVRTWRSNTEATHTYFAFQVERARLGITARVGGVKELDLADTALGQLSYGISQRQQKISPYTIQSWSMVVNQACRYHMMVVSAIFNRTSPVTIIGGRDLGEVCNALGRPVTVYDNLAEAVKRVEVYDLTIVTSHWDYAVDGYEDGHVYWFNFVIMAPNLDGTIPSSLTQVKRISDMIDRLKASHAHPLICLSLYVNSTLDLVVHDRYLPAWSDFQVHRSPTTPGRYLIKVGAYDPVEMLNIEDLAPFINDEDLTLTIRSPNWSEIISGSVLHGSIPPAGSLDKITAFSSNIKLMEIRVKA